MSAIGTPYRIAMVDDTSVWVATPDGETRVSRRDGSAITIGWHHADEDALALGGPFTYRLSSFVTYAVSMAEDGPRGVRRHLLRELASDGPSRQYVGWWSYLEAYGPHGGRAVVLEGGLGPRALLAASRCGVFWASGTLSGRAVDDTRLDTVWRAEVGHAPVAIARGAHWVTSIGADDTEVWWTTATEPDEVPQRAGVFRAPCRGGAKPVRVPDGETGASSEQARVTRAGGRALSASEQIAYAGMAVAFDDTHVYSYVASGEQAREVVRVPRNGGAPETVLDDVESFVLDHGFVYGVRQGVLVRVSAEGPRSLETVVDRPGLSRSFWVDQGEVFFLEGSWLMRAPVVAGPRTPEVREPAAGTGAGADVDLALVKLEP
jgi:hypothetical protein